MFPTSKVTDIWCEPGFRGLTPLDIQRDSSGTIRSTYGKTIVRFRDNLLVKYGTKVKDSEARALRYIKKNTSIPVPSVYAVFTYEPDGNDDLVDRKAPTQTYIVMDLVPGEILTGVWYRLDSQAKSAVCRTLAGYVEQLRSLESPPFIGSLLLDPVRDFILEGAADQGPFHSIVEFHNALAQRRADRGKKGDMEPHVSQVLNNHGYAVKYTHADLEKSNIMVQENGDITGIVGWDTAGYYPEYWEFVKMYHTGFGEESDWDKAILENFRPYLAESAAYKTIEMW